MTTSVRAIPEGYHSVTPSLIVANAAGAMAFYKKVFGATEVMRMAAPGGKIGHAEIEVGGSRILLADEYPDMGFRSPKGIGGTPVSLRLYVEDVDAVAARALAVGARQLRPIKDRVYGDRSGTVEDPFGHVWHIATLQGGRVAGRAEAARRGGDATARVELTYRAAGARSAAYPAGPV